MIKNLARSHTLFAAGNRFFFADYSTETHIVFFFLFFLLSHCVHGHEHLIGLSCPPPPVSVSVLRSTRRVEEKKQEKKRD